MAQVPTHLRYTEEHEWVESGTDGTATVGITDFAQKNLGDIVFFELPEVGRRSRSGTPSARWSRSSRCPSCTARSPA